MSAAVANGLLISVPSGRTATVTLTDVRGDAAHRSRLASSSPAGAVDGLTWVTVTGWQGEGLHVDYLVKERDGVYRTSAPMPLHGGWKTLIRVHDGRTLVVPVYLPADPAIGAGELPAPAEFTRDVQGERPVLQRELKTGVPGWLWAVCSAVVLACTLALVIALGWGVARIARRLPAPVKRARRRARERRRRILATHPLITAVPFFVPTFIVVAVIAVVIWRDRRRGDDTRDDARDDASGGARTTRRANRRLCRHERPAVPRPVPVGAVLAGGPGRGRDRGSSGIGRAIAVALARSGASVVVVARREAELAATVAELAGHGCRAAAVSADLGSRDAVAEAAERAAAAFGSPTSW